MVEWVTPGSQQHQHQPSTCDMLARTVGGRKHTQLSVRTKFFTRAEFPYDARAHTRQIARQFLDARA